MQGIEVLEKTLPQSRTVLRGLRGIVYGKGRNSPQKRFGGEKKHNYWINKH
jgi:hypothetical protein